MNLPFLSRRQAQAGRPSPGRVPEPNLLPPAFKPAPLLTPRTLVLLLLALEVLVAAAVYQTQGQAAVDGARVLVSSLFPQESEEAARIVRLERVLAGVEEEAAGLERAYGAIAGQADWAFLLQEVFARGGTAIGIQSFREAASGLAINGRAPAIPDVETYRTRLLEMPEVADVTVSGIQQDVRSGGLTFSFDIVLK